MSFDFDVEKITEQITEMAKEHLLQLMRDARDEMGINGQAIRIEESAAMERDGDKVTFGGIHFPSISIKDRFLEIVREKMT